MTGVRLDEERRRRFVAAAVEPWGHRVLRGARVAAVAGVAFSALYLVVLLLDGDPLQAEMKGWMGRTQRPLWTFFTCLVALPSTGALLGLAFPLMRNRAAACALGAAATLPLFLSLVASTIPAHSWGGDETVAAALMALFVGGCFGVVLRDEVVQGAEPEPEKKRRRRRSRRRG
ncbi:MAG TPA: hypothetical protein VF263_09340 [Longimicrobiaceae bacterium]